MDKGITSKLLFFISCVFLIIALNFGLKDGTWAGWPYALIPFMIGLLLAATDKTSPHRMLVKRLFITFGIVLGAIALLFGLFLLWVGSTL